MRCSLYCLSASAVRVVAPAERARQAGPSDGAKSTVSKMIMQMGERPPMEMPMQMNPMSEQRSQPVDIRGQAEDSGTESVTTPAGTFSAHHHRMKDGSGDSWISEQISP
jgi:hypothetical protein